MKETAFLHGNYSLDMTFSEVYSHLYSDVSFYPRIPVMPNDYTRLTQLLLNVEELLNISECPKLRFLFSELTVCVSPKTVHPRISLCTLLI